MSWFSWDVMGSRTQQKTCTYVVMSWPTKAGTIHDIPYGFLSEVSSLLFLFGFLGHQKTAKSRTKVMDFHRRSHPFWSALGCQRPPKAANLIRKDLDLYKTGQFFSMSSVMSWTPEAGKIHEGRHGSL